MLCSSMMTTIQVLHTVKNKSLCCPLGITYICEHNSAPRYCNGGCSLDSSKIEDCDTFYRQKVKTLFKIKNKNVFHRNIVLMSAGTQRPSFFMVFEIPVC